MKGTGKQLYWYKNMFDKSELKQLKSKTNEECILSKHDSNKITSKLMDLKNKEPTSDRPFFRLAIIGYEFGKTMSSLEHEIVYAERFKQGIVDSNKERNAYLKNAQLEIGDCLAQLQLLCITYGFDYIETRQLGVKHLEERHEDFKRKGWTEIK